MSKSAASEEDTYSSNRELENLAAPIDLDPGTACPATLAWAGLHHDHKSQK